MPDWPENIEEKVFCIVFGTIIGIGIYAIFLYFKIAIFGWNLGLIFAPLLAGYCETLLADKLMDEATGAISAFILFIGTTYYSFIVANPLLGVNFITVGSVAVILQAAFPTLINYVLIVVGIGAVVYIIRVFKKIIYKFYYKIKYTVYKYVLKKPFEIKTKVVEDFDEMGSNQKLNSLDFIFITSTDVLDKNVINLGQFQSTVILEKDKNLINLNPKQNEKETLKRLKSGKDECLINLTKKIKASGGNGVIDLDIQYCLIGLGGDNYQISSMGTGVYIE